MIKKKIAIASDHGGYQLKNAVISYFKENDIEYKDFGCFSSESCDYPDFAVPCCNAVINNEAELGILICGTGIGMSIAANKIKGIRAACCSDTYSARFTRLHNDANVLCIGARVLGEGLALDIIRLFMETEHDPEGGKHTRRLQKIALLEK